MSRLTLVKNAFANLCRGGAAALVTLLLPPFLTRILSKDAYGTWLLILQLSTYVGFLDFGIQTAVGRYVAYCNELGDTKQRDSIVTTSLVILTAAGALAIVGVSLLAWQLPHLFKDMPNALHQDARIALLCVGGSLAIALPFNVFGAIFIGLQRYDVPAWIIGSSKLLGGLFVVLIAQSSHSIVMMGIVMGIANLLTGFWQYIAYKKIVNGIQISTKQISRSAGIEIFSYCFSLSIWTIAMILIGGLDTIIIGYFDYKSVAYYTLAASLTNFLVSTCNSTLSVIMPKAASMGAQGNRESLGQLLVLSTKYCVTTLIIISLPLLISTKPLLTFWVGSEYAEKTTSLLQLLIVGNGIRYIGAAYSTIVVAIGEQKKVILSPLLEGLFNLFTSLWFTFHYGAIGVAIGTICAGIFSVFMHLFYNLPRTVSIETNQHDLIITSVIKPILAVSPSIFLWYILVTLNSSQEAIFLFSVVTNVIAWICLWNSVLSVGDRRRILVRIHSSMSRFI